MGVSFHRRNETPRKSKMSILLEPITGWRDPNLPFVMDILQQSFPPNEQMRLSWWINRLNAITEGMSTDGEKYTLLAVVNPQTEEVVGFAYYETYAAPPEKSIAYLYYLAMHPETRGQGIGATTYAALMQRILDQEKNRLVVFEVEKPEVLETLSPNDAEIARRRVRWYQRNGARLLNGVYYSQSVGWQPEVEMNVMFHSRNALRPEDAFAAGKAIWADNLQQISPLTWNGYA